MQTVLFALSEWIWYYQDNPKEQKQALKQRQGKPLPAAKVIRKKKQA